MENMDKLFTPQTIAVIGASANPAKLGHTVLKNILDGKFSGTVYAVNPKGTNILGVPTYTSVTAIPEHVDLAVVAVPGPVVPAVAEECGQAGVSAVIVIAAGFTEIGEAGARLEAELKKTVAKHGLRLLGPNCLGIIDPPGRLNASFASAMPEAGAVAVLGQSGAMGTAILDWAKGASLGFSAFVSLGNKADITESDLLERWVADRRTNVVLAYLESITDGRRFVRTATELTRQKPLVLLKAGVSDAGAAAAGSHTGSLTGSDEVLGAALQRAGVTRADSIEELFDVGEAFACCPLPKGRRVAIVTNAGGPAVVTADAVTAAGLEMATLSKRTRELLGKALPAEANTANPIDCVGDARASRYQVALSAALRDKQVDAVLVLLTPQAMTEVVPTAEVTIRAARATDKPVLASFIGGEAVVPGLAKLRQAGLAAYPSPERAVGALAKMAEYADYRRRPAPRPPKRQKPKPHSIKILRQTLADGQPALWGLDAAEFVGPYGIPGPAMVEAASADEAVKLADVVTYPVVMKIDSPDILHKSDVGGVILHLETPEQVRQSFDNVTKHIKKTLPDARLRGVTLNHEVPDGQDWLVGAKRDQDFGPVVVAGYGGVYVEVFRDVSFALAPVTNDEALEMISRTRSAGLLNGVRGQPAVDTKGLVKAIVAISHLINEIPDIDSIDLNPLRLFPSGVMSLDTRIILQHTADSEQPTVP